MNFDGIVPVHMSDMGESTEVLEEEISIVNFGYSL